MLRLLKTPEDEQHDFKEKWYVNNDGNSEKAEMLKDIFSFVNTTHDKDCYLIFGVKDSNREIVGIENDKHRYNTQQINDWLKRLPIEPEIPKVRIETIKIQDHEIDIMIIKNTDEVPVFLKYLNKGKGYGKHPIYPGQIFSRVEDTNTSIDETATYRQLMKLFKKKLGVNQSIEKRYKKVLKDWGNWYYFENTYEVGIRYQNDSDFKIIFIDNEEASVKATSYSLSQERTDVHWQIARLEYKNDIIKETSIVCLDNSSFRVVTPKAGSIRGRKGTRYYYKYYLKDSTDFYLEELINKVSELAPDEGSLIYLAQSIVVYEDEEQLKYFSDNKEISTPIIKEDIIDIYRNKLLTDIPSNSIELNDTAIKGMINEIETGKYIKSILRTDPDYLSKIPEIWYRS